MNSYCVKQQSLTETLCCYKLFLTEEEIEIIYARANHLCLIKKQALFLISQGKPKDNLEPNR